MSSSSISNEALVVYEPGSEKTGLRGFRPGLTQMGCIATEDV